jgi:hypothetical protein
LNGSKSIISAKSLPYEIFLSLVLKSTAPKRKLKWRFRWYSEVWCYATSLI